MQDSAGAQESASALSLSAPEGCPDALALRTEVSSLVGRPLDEIVLPAGLDPEVTIRSEGARFVLEVRDAEGARTLHDGSCPALVRAAALIIALRIDADAATLAAAAAAEPEPTPTPETTLEPRVEPHPPTPTRTVGVRRRRFGRGFDASEWSRRLAVPYRMPTLPTVSIGAGAIVEGGLVPSITASFAADLVVRADRFEARVRGVYVVEQNQPGIAGIAASAVIGTLLGCGRPFDYEFAIAFCGGVEAGPLFERSYGVTNTAQGVSATVAGVLGVWLPLFPWRTIDVSLGVEAWARLLRPDVHIEGLGSVWSSELFGGRFALLVHFGI